MRSSSKKSRNAKQLDRRRHLAVWFHKDYGSSMAAKTAKIETMSGWAGFAKAALDVLGKAAPWVVIGCLSAFGIYKLQELNGQNLAAVQAIAEKERTQARNDFSVANQALKDTYEAANKLYTEMIASVGSSLKQLQQLETEVRDKQKSVYESQIAAERTKAALEAQQTELKGTQERVDQVKKEGEAALAAQKVAEASVRELTVSLEREKADLAQIARQLDETRRQVDDKRSELRQAVSRLTDVSGLVTELAHLPDNPKISSLVGTKLSELRGLIKNVEGFQWFAGFQRGGRSRGDELNIVAIPDDQKGKSFIGSSLVLKLSGTLPGGTKELLTNILGDNSTDSTVTSAELQYAFSFRCVDPETFASVKTMTVLRRGWVYGSPARQVGEKITLTEELGHIVFGVVFDQLKGETWPLAIYSPAEALKLIPDISTRM
jgi:hypothetical protein